MGNKIRLLFFSFICVCSSVLAGDTVKTARPQFISTNVSGGFILPNSRMAPRRIAPHYPALTLKYGLSARGDSWQDELFGMPYKGIGVFIPRLSHREELGDPFSVFLFQGARLKQINSTLSMNYEINLGVSFNWKHYDAERRPWLLSIGSSTNVHLAGNWYLKWRLSRYLDLHAGVGITHFSNGALRTPNYGVNGLSAFVEMAYNLYPREEKKAVVEGVYTPPAFKKSKVHDLAFMLTTRTIKIDTVDTGLISKYPKKRFKVAGMSYSYMFHNSRRFMFGPSVEAVYDESSNVKATGETDPETGKYTEHIRYGKVADRFSVGLSLKGELTMPGYSIFANVGYDVYHKNKLDKSFYTIYGLKVYLVDNLFATLGVRSVNLTRSQYLYLNIGYTIR